jgi:hypothetical protein
MNGVIRLLFVFGSTLVLSAVANAQTTEHRFLQDTLDLTLVNPIDVQPSFREQPRALSLHERVKVAERRGDLHPQRQACVSRAVLGFEAQHSEDIPADAHGHRAQP